MKNKYSGLRFLAFLPFSVAVWFVYKSEKRKPVDMFETKFRSVITGIKKQARGRYDLTCKTQAGEILELVVNGFYSYRDLVVVGDSLVKEQHSNCFQYKRKDSLQKEVCKGVELY